MFPNYALLPSLALLLAFTPVLPVIRAVLPIPLWISFILTIGLGAALRALIRSPSRVTPNHCRRYGLHALSFTTPSAWSAVLTRTEWEERPPSSTIPKPKSSSANALNARLDIFLTLINDHFIKPWYDRISPSVAFPNSVELLVRKALDDIASRSENIDWPALVVSRISPILQDHLRHYRTVEHLSSTSTAPQPALPLPLPDHAHPALSHSDHISSKTPLSQIESHFRDTIDRVVVQIIADAEHSPVVSTIVREILLGNILLPVFEMLCDSDFLNRQIDERGGRYLHEQKQVNKFLSALSSLPDPSSGIDSRQNSPLRKKAAVQTSSITAASSTGQFEAFIRSISKVKTLGEARRLKADIEREQRFAKMDLDGETRRFREDKTAEAAVKKAKRYSKRLERARMEIVTRIDTLSKRQGKSTDNQTAHRANGISLDTAPDEIDLLMVLSDTSSSAYWLEFMERRKRSRLYQIWVTIEGFKDPLEGLSQNATVDGTLVSADQNPQSSQTVHEELKHLHREYLSQPDSVLAIPPRHRNSITTLAMNDILENADMRKAKQAMFAIQQAVYEQMEEEDWHAFKKTELYLKCSADLSRSTVPQPLSPINSPILVTSATLLSSPTPPAPFRQMTSSLLSSKPKSRPQITPTAKAPQALIDGHFSPTSVAPATTLSFAPPDLGRRVTFPDIRPMVARSASAEKLDMSASIDSLASINPRRSSNLDFLIGGNGDKPEEVRQKLFDDDEEDIVPDPGVDDLVQAQCQEAIRAALEDCIAGDDMAASQTFERSEETPEPEISHSPSSSMILIPSIDKTEPLGKLSSRSVGDLRAPTKRTHNSAPQSRKTSGQPSAPHRSSSSSLTADAKPKHLFDDEHVSDDDQPPVEGLDMQDGLQMNISGNVSFEEQVRRLQEKIEELVKQQYRLEPLIRQAELTGNAQELRLLERSMASVRRKQCTAILQKAQIEQQEEEKRLVPGTTKVFILTAVVVDDDREGKAFVRYNITIRQGEEAESYTWQVSRRYNEFWELDKALRDWASDHGLSKLFRNIPELPPKKLVPNLSSGFIESRRQGLERYLQALVSIKDLCCLTSLRSFLSHSNHSASLAESSGSSSLTPQNIVKSIYNTITTSLDNNILGPNTLDMMYSALSRQLTDLGGKVGIGSDELAGMGSLFLPQAFKTGWMKDDQAEVNGKTTVISPMNPISEETGTGPFSAPICDLFVEMFDLKENNWLRRQAIVVILQQFLGSTIERQVRDSIKSALSPSSFEKYIFSLQETLFPEGQRRPPAEPRTEEEKAETQYRASKKLGMLIPDMAANMVGRGNARRAARRVFGMVQDKRLNQHLVLCIMDEIFGALFPVQKGRQRG